MAKVSKQAEQVAKEYINDARFVIKIQQAILFGSAARGQMNKNSDIDIIVISREFEKMNLEKRLILLSQLRGKKYLKWPMDILGYTPDEFKKLSRVSSMFAEAKKQGVIIK